MTSLSLQLFDWLLIPMLMCVGAGFVFVALQDSILTTLTFAVALFLCLSYLFRLIRKSHHVRLKREIEVASQLEKELKHRRASWLQAEQEFMRNEKAAQAQFVKTETDRVSRIRSLFDGDTSIMVEQLEDALSILDFAFDSSVGMKVTSSSTVLLDVDLPEIEDCITAVEKKTGHVEDQYVYSFKIDKETFAQVNFENADPVKAVDNFEARRKLLILSRAILINQKPFITQN